MSKVVASAKFAEVGLKVSRNTAAKPRVTVQDVATSVMELKEKNFEEMSLKEFQRAVVLATKPLTAAALRCAPTRATDALVLTIRSASVGTPKRSRSDKIQKCGGLP